MKKKSALVLLAFGTALSIAFLSTYCLGAEFKPVTLKYSHYVTQSSWHGELNQWWANEVEKRTGGKVKIKIFWMDSLTKIKDGLPSVQSGMAEMGWISSTYHPSQLPLFLVLDNVFNFGDDYVSSVMAITDAMENEPNLKAELERENIIQVIPHCSGHAQIGSKKITSLADLKGKTLRTYGGSRTNYYTQLGANPIFMAFPDLYEAMDRGTIDAIGDMAVVLASGFKLYEVCKTVLLINAGGSLASGGFMNLKVFKSLPPDIQKTLLDLRRDYGAKMAQKESDDEVVYYKEWNTKHGVTIKSLSPEEQKINVEAGKAAQESFIKQQESKGAPAARKVWDYYMAARLKYEAERAKKK
jgi:TRAP-type C4-dicarboxylate transport system substrate-binding protein